MFCPNCGQENEDSVRHCKNCGTFIPDLSILGGDEPSAPAAPQPPLTYNALTQEQMQSWQNDQSRYQEYSMSDVVAKKSHKKLITWLIVTAAVLVLGVAIFFLVRFIISSVTVGKIKDDPTKYVVSAYQTTAKGITGSSDILKTLVSEQATQKTTKTTVTSPYGVQQTITSVDSDNKKVYFMESIENKNSLSAQSAALADDFAPTYTMPSNIALEFYSTLDRGVLKRTVDGKSVDYYLDYNNLRQDALNSAFGPQGENILHLDQKNYDTIMDVYEFVYNNLKQTDNPFGIMDLVDKMLDDFDKCGNVNVSEENASIDGTSVNAYVITHTFTNTDVIKTLVNDLKDWAKTNININEDVNKMIEDAFAKADIDTALAQLNVSGQLNDFELTFKHYVSKDSALMQSEILLKKGGQGLKLTLCFGADPVNSKNIVLKAATTSGEDQEMVVQSITVKDESTDSDEKYTVSYVGFVLNGSTTYSRNKASGDFTLTNNMTLPMSSMGGFSSGNQYDVAPEFNTANQPQNITITGNMKVTDDSVTTTYTMPSAYGSDEGVSVEVYVSNKAEITELTSNNNILKATSKELTKAFSF